MSLLFYRRPDYVEKNQRPMSASDYQKYSEKQRAAIPPELSFEYVVANRAIPPCSLQDFMGYLLYVSHDAENLQFYLWFQDYSKRFLATPRTEQALSPLWDDDAALAVGSDPGPGMPDKRPGLGTEFQFDFDTNEVTLDPITGQQPVLSAAALSNPAHTVEVANSQMGLKWQSFTIQPFRSEINRVISHYLAPGSPRELNLSQRDRTACLRALQHTTHPSAFSVPMSVVTDSLRSQSHPNFIRWSLVNGNKPRMIFGRSLGAVNILFGFVIAIVLTLSSKPRWYRLFAALAWLLGFNFLLAGSNGICLVLYATRDRHLRPWEQYSNDSWPSQMASDDSDEVTLAGSDMYSMSPVHGKKRHFALEAFGTANSYGHEVWVDKYRAKMMVRKVFDTRVWVQNESVRLMQDKVALQALIWSIIVTVPLTALFAAVPKGSFY
ncbi:hypothetical protein MMC07_005076 [Pseudocyphellaria aurata]|nr:hypothetical protein [Pseudocyphellaria aurata]